MLSIAAGLPSAVPAESHSTTWSSQVKYVSQAGFSRSKVAFSSALIALVSTSSSQV